MSKFQYTISSQGCFIIQSHEGRKCHLLLPFLLKHRLPKSNVYLNQRSPKCFDWILQTNMLWLYIYENSGLGTYSWLSSTEPFLIMHYGNGVQVNIRDHSSITSSKGWVDGVGKWQFLMIYSTVNHQRVWWVGLKKSKTWWRNTWMVP